MTPKYILVFLAWVLAMSFPFSHSGAQDKLILDLDKPALTKMPIAVPDFVSQNDSSISGKELANIIRNDLQLTGLFQIVDSTLKLTNGEPNLDSWSETGAQALIVGQYHTQGNEITIDLRLYDLGLKQMEIGKKYSGQLQDHRRIVHLFGNRVMEKLAGSPGCFTSKIAFVNESAPKEIYMMDYDGFNVQQMTQNKSLVMSPEWTPDGKGILFTSYLNQNPDLWLLDLTTFRQFPVSARAGINASGRFSPDGQQIALSLSFNGIPKLFIINPQGNITNRLTEGRGNDISPTWSPDAMNIAYVSDQAGSPQIYVAPVPWRKAEKVNNQQ